MVETFLLLLLLHSPQLCRSFQGDRLTARSSVKVGRVTDMMSRGGENRQTKQLHDSLVYHLLCPSPRFSVLILFCGSSDGKQDILTNLTSGRH